MNLATIQTPGVYINEIKGFPGSVVPVATAVPAFIGYTPQAMYEGKSYLNVPMAVNSFSEFQTIFCLPDPPAPAPKTKQYSPEYYLVKQKSQPDKGDYTIIDNTYYSIVPDPATIYYLYNSVKIFYDNGGGTAYIVSVGGYGPPSGKPMDPSAQLINPNVEVNDLLGGLNLLLNQQEPTMYICPEATLLSVANNAMLMQEMLATCVQTQTSVSIFDIIGGNAPDPILFTQDIQTFRNNTGANGLNYGTAYYPFLITSIMQNTDIDYTNLFGGDLSQLAPLLSPPDNPDPTTATILANIANPPGPPLTVTQNNNALLIASTVYSNIIQNVLLNANILPPSGAMAGVITTMDNSGGPWLAPANTSIVGAAALPINLSTTQQANLNVDAISGKSINVIRSFNGYGILVWGARTLDGNDNDWRYLSVRRTVTYIEQSCKLAAHPYVFQPNDKNTWQAVIAMISSFLTSVWKAGGLVGASPGEAFKVICGLGSTMTSDDIVAGFMNVSVQIAVVRPAEFILITFQQQQQTS